MKTYEATYTDKNGKVVSQAKFEAKNLKEARSKAQFHKTHASAIQQAGRVKTFVGCRADLLKKLDKTLYEVDALKKVYEEYKEEFHL